MEREDIQIIARHSNWSEKDIKEALKKHVYNDKEAWHKFLRLFFISLGIGFTVSGILFFFAYNWADLHKFIKIGLIEGLILALTFIVLFSKISLEIKNILLTGASVLVGVLFAVFGQIYQTGANAYDFFLSWTVFIAIWVLVSSYPPLWLVLITLINTTLVLYSEQVAQDWSTVFLCILLFVINVLFLMVFLFGNRVYHKLNTPIWFSNLIALASVAFSVIGIVNGIFEEYDTLFCISILITSVFYVLGILYGLTMQRGFYLSIIPFSVIVIISAFLFKLSKDESMFFLISLFVIGSVTLVIKNLINLQKKWAS